MMNEDERWARTFAKVVLLVSDNDKLDVESIREELERNRYLHVRVVRAEIREVEDYHDGHPLNQRSTWREAFSELFEEEEPEDE